MYLLYLYSKSSKISNLIRPALVLWVGYRMLPLYDFGCAKYLNCISITDTVIDIFICLPHLENLYYYTAFSHVHCLQINTSTIFASLTTHFQYCRHKIMSVHL